MKEALLFRENEDCILVSAEEVKAEKYSRDEEFVDPEYEFRVQYVKGAKGNGGPYFRYYYSIEDYSKLHPDKATKYEIVRNMRHCQESPWHKRWEDNLSDFCETEKHIKNPSTGKYKRADAFYGETNTSIEFQHSYIDKDFEKRNDFYSKLLIKTIWLYDLTKSNVRENEQGYLEILEDNSKGFFRISERPENLKNHYVYIQVKSGYIYRVCELFRCESSTENKSTIRYFAPTETYTEDEFIDAIKSNEIGSENVGEKPKTLAELWNPEYSSMIVKNIKDNVPILINRGFKKEMYRDFGNGCIAYKYADDKYDTPMEEKKDIILASQTKNHLFGSW